MVLWTFWNLPVWELTKVRYINKRLVDTSIYVICPEETTWFRLSSKFRNSPIRIPNMWRTLKVYYYIEHLSSKTRDLRHGKMFLLIIPYWIERRFFWKKLSLERVINYLNKSWVGSRKCPPSDTYLPKILLS